MDLVQVFPIPSAISESEILNFTNNKYLPTQKSRPISNHPMHVVHYGES